MSSQTDLQLVPSHPVALLCTLPWTALAIFAALVAREQGYGFLVLTLPLLAGAVHQYRCQGLLAGGSAVTRLRVANGQLYACLGSGAEIAVVAANESRVSARFTILKLRRPGTILPTYNVVLASLGPWFCNTSPEAFRQLRVWLRLGLPPGARESHPRRPAYIRETH